MQGWSGVGNVGVQLGGWVMQGWGWVMHEWGGVGHAGVVWVGCCV